MKIYKPVRAIYVTVDKASLLHEIIPQNYYFLEKLIPKVLPTNSSCRKQENKRGSSKKKKGETKMAKIASFEGKTSLN